MFTVFSNYKNALSQCRHIIRLSAYSCAAPTLTFDLLS